MQQTEADVDISDVYSEAGNNEASTANRDIMLNSTAKDIYSSI